LQNTEETCIVRAADRRLIRELALVLNSCSIPHRVVQATPQSWIAVPTDRAEEALQELANYRAENQGRQRHKEAVPKVHPGAWPQALLWSVVLVLVHILAVQGALGLNWVESGLASSAGVAGGDWWRPITALTLHSDLQHILSNLFFGAVFVGLLVQVLGAQLTWPTVVISAALGNLLNLFVSGAEHRSLGASTAVFAALGALTAVQFSRKLASSRARMTRWVPLIAGGLLLAWNGMGSTRLGPGLEVQRQASDNTDIGAHIAGFVMGLALGFVVWRLEQRAWFTPRGRRALALATAALVVAAWGAALVSETAA
jgi:membrane associated rhomboid family serine protease